MTDREGDDRGAADGTPGADDGIPALGPLDPRDYSRRTQLANERTYLAWWRTGLAALTVALASARVVPELAGTDTRWPYVLLGAGFALAGLLCVAYGEHRRRAVDAALRRGAFAEPSPLVTGLLTGLGVALGLGLLAIVLIGP